MNLVNLEAAVKAYGDRVLLDRVSLGVAAGDRIGVVGRNGGRGYARDPWAVRGFRSGMGSLGGADGAVEAGDRAASL